MSQRRQRAEDVATTTAMAEQSGLEARGLVTDEKEEERVPESVISEVSLSDTAHHTAHEGDPAPVTSATGGIGGGAGNGVEIEGEVVEDLSSAMNHSQVQQEGDGDGGAGGYTGLIVVDDCEPTDEGEGLNMAESPQAVAPADVVGFAEKYSVEMAAKRFNIPVMTIQSWVKLSDEIQQQQQQQQQHPKFNSPGQGRKITYSQATDCLIADHIRELLAKGERVTLHYLCSYAKAHIHQENPQFNASQGWAQRFLLRHDIDLGDHGKKTSSGGGSKQDARSSERGRPLSYSTETDQNIADWVRTKQLEGTLVTNSELRKYAKALILKENPNFTGSASWAQNFLLRHKLSLHNQSSGVGGGSGIGGGGQDSMRGLGSEMGSPQSLAVSSAGGGGSSMSGGGSELSSHHTTSSMYSDPVVTASSEYTPDSSADDPMKTALAILTGETIDSTILNPAQAAALQNTLSELASENVSLVDLLNSTHNLHDHSGGGDGNVGGFSHSLDPPTSAALYLTLQSAGDPSFHTLAGGGGSHNLGHSFKLHPGRFESDTGPASRPLSYTKETDHALAKWVHEQQATGRKVTFASLRSYAKKLVQSENPNFNASVGWVTPFLLRHNLDLSVNKKMKLHRKLKVADFSGSDNDSDEVSLLREGDLSNEGLNQQDEMEHSDVAPPSGGGMGENGVDGESDPSSIQVLHLQPENVMISVSDRAHDSAIRSTLKITGITSSVGDECGGRLAGKRSRSSARSRHTLAEKLEVVRLMKEYNVAGHYVCRMLGIANSTIAGWIKLVQQKGPELEALSVNKKRANVSGQGRPLSYSRAKDDAIAQWVLAQQEQGAQVTSTDLAKYATNLIGQENSNFTASTGWQQKFLQRHNLQLTPKASGDRVPLVEDQQSIPTPVQTEEVVTHESMAVVEKPYSEETEEQLIEWVRSKVAECGSIDVQTLCQYAEDITVTSNPSFVATLGWAFRFLHRNKLLLDPKPHAQNQDGSTPSPTGTPGSTRRRPLGSPEYSTPKKLRTKLEQAVTMSPSTGNLCEALLALSNPAEGATPESVQAVMEVMENAMQQVQAAAVAARAAASQQTQSLEDEVGGDLQTNTSTYFGKPAREFTPEEKEEVVRYANATTLQKAASRYGVAAPTVWRWRVELKLHQPKYTAMQKKYIIKFAENNSLKEAGQRFGITTKTIQNWRKALHAEGLMSDEGANGSQELQEGMDPADISGGSDMVNYDGQNFQFIVDGGEVVDGNTRCAEQGGGGEGSVRADSVPLEVTNEVDIENVGMEYDIVSSEGHSAKPRCTQQEKMQILQYALDHSIKEASQKYGISPGTLYYWKKNLNPSVTGSGSVSAGEQSPSTTSDGGGTYSLMTEASVGLGGNGGGGNVTLQFSGGQSGDGSTIQVLPALVTSDAVVLPISEALLASAGTTAETVQALSQTLASMSQEALQNLPADFNLLQAVTNLLSNVEAANDSVNKHKLGFYKLAAALSREMASPTDILIPFSDQPTSDAEQTVLTEAHSAVLEQQVVTSEEVVSTNPVEGINPAASHQDVVQSAVDMCHAQTDSTTSKEP